MDSFSRIVFCTVLLFQHTWSLGKKRFMLFFKAFPIVKFSEALNVKHLKFCVKKELVSREAFCNFCYLHFLSVVWGLEVGGVPIMIYFSIPPC